MCPTELLAEQHYLTITNLLNNVLPELQVELLLGGTRKALKKEIQNNIETGITNIIIGTHSLFQKDMLYNNLGLVVIDEQHRFGVSQRAELINLAKVSFNISKDAKCSAPTIPHILFMSATPIPRTMTMTMYGDLDVSIIKTLPKNRLPIATRVCFDEQRNQIYEFAENNIKQGRQIYIVYPLIEKSEKMEYKSAVEHYEIIANEIFPQYECGLLHGQLNYTDKEEVMKKFLNNEFKILVATTVIEVGIDVPNATIMIIEDADRFGLAQLHQLRGRVGRGTEKSYCFLMTKDNFKFRFEKSNKNNIEEEKINSIIRLKAIQSTNDGFKLSEIDMKLRGPGDMLGTRQSGMPDFKYIDLINDIDIIQTCSQIAKSIIAEDPDLILDKNKIIKDYYNNHIKDSDNFIHIA
jgi:ATP-dependent DNA helicase RecG